jgi:hypothetical protein
LRGAVVRILIQQRPDIIPEAAPMAATIPLWRRFLFPSLALASAVGVGLFIWSGVHKVRMAAARMNSQ